MKKVVVACALGVVVAVCTVVAVSTFGRPPARAVALPPIDDLRNGDLIFRSGISRNSEFIKFVDSRSKYSHVGLVDVRDGNVYIVHIEPGQSDADSRVRREPIAEFLETERANGFAIFHVTTADDERGRRAIKAALAYQSRGVSFDNDFDLDSLDELYCSELVWRAYLESGLDLLDGDFGRLSSVSGKRLIRLTALSESPHVQFVLAQESTK